MAFDGIITKSVVAELNTCLINGKIDKVFEPNKNEILLGIYSNKKNYLLNISIDPINYRIHLTTNSKPNPLNAPNFCMVLRKHILGTRIKSIYNYGLERVITIELEGYDELNDLTTKKLIIELMGKHSNVILLNKNNYIIDSLRHLDISSNSYRDILPAHEYNYPNITKKSFFDINSFDEFYNLISNNLNLLSLEDIISNEFNGISKNLVKSILDRHNISIKNLEKSHIEQIYQELKNIISPYSSLNCTEYMLSNNKLDYVAILSKEVSPLEINFFLDDFYNKKETVEEFKTYRNNILKLILNELSKYSKRLININNKIEECSNMDNYRLYGELITANLYKLKNINTDKIILENYYNDNLPIDIPLDKSISIPANAKKYFKKYNKLKNALAIVKEQKNATSKEIDYLESIVFELENAKNISEINDIYTEISENVLFKNKISNSKNSKTKNKKTNLSSANLLAYNIDGYTIYVGKNNKQNDYLSLKFANSNDIWFHTKDIHGSHVLLRIDTENQQINSNILVECAKLAAINSKAKNSSNIPVDYTYAKYVKKPNGAKPGMVIYTNYKTLYVNP